MEKKNTGFKVFVTIISLGITFSLFGKFNIIEKIEIVMSEDKENDSAKQNPTPEPITEETPNPLPVPTEIVSLEPTEQPTAPPLATPERTDTIDLGTIDQNPEIIKISVQIENDQDDEQTKSENDSSSDKSSSDFSQDNNIFNETNESSTNTLCQLTFESSGKLIMTTNEDNLSNSDSTIDIKCDSENDANTHGLLSYNYSDLVNDKNSSEELTSFISVTQGTYIVNFVNCSLDNVNFYFENNTEESYEELVIPTNEHTKVEISKDNQSKTFKASFVQGFKPLINFYSDNMAEKNLILKILDENKSELQRVELNYVNSDGSHDFAGDFSFDDGKEYYIQVSAVDNVELSQTCYFMISQISEADSVETNYE